MSIEAMKQAVEALEEACEIVGAAWTWRDEKGRPAITALRAAIEQAEKQEPVAWVLQFIDDEDEEDDDLIFEIYESERQCRADAKRDGGVCKPLYLAPPQRPWVGLTRNEAMEIVKSLVGQDWMYAVDAIETKLKEKNV
jgi:hypothetical protein